VESLDGIVEGLRTRGVEGLDAALADVSAAAGRPPLAFGAAIVDGDCVNVAVRGDAVVLEIGPTAARTLDTSSGAQERHESWDSAQGVRIAAAGADATVQGALWIGAGVVFAATIDIDVKADAAATADAAVKTDATSSEASSGSGQPAGADDAATSAAPMETMIPELTESVRLSAPPVQATPEPGDGGGDPAGEDEEWDATISINQYRKIQQAQQAAAAAPSQPPALPQPPAPSQPPAPPRPPAPPASASPTPAPRASGLIDEIPESVRVTTTGPVSSVPVAAPALGDHDGATVSVAEMLAMQGGVVSAPAQTGTGSFSQRRRGRARISSGQVIEIDRTIIIGRLPRASRVTGQPPELVAVPSPQQDISRNHVEIRLEGSAVVVVDLNTTNGTVLQRVGADAVRLHPGEPTVVTDGDVIDLGDNVTVTFEGLE
jgi:hypothetical protein